MDGFVAGDFDELDGFAVAWFETDRCAGGYI